LESICAQTFASWECVIVNDGGLPDRVDALVDALPAEHRTRVRVLHSPDSRGRWASANAGIAETTAALLVLHDDDDTWHPSFLETSVRYLTQNPDRHGVVSRIQIVWERIEGEKVHTIRTEPFLPDSVAPLLMDQMRFNHFVPIAFLYRRSLHDTVGMYDERLPVIADWQFNTHVLTAGPLEYVSPTPLAYWHQRPDASGVDGNSVIAERSAHAVTDALLRDDAFRQMYSQDARGMALYFERRIREVEELVKAQQIALIRELTSPVTVVLRRTLAVLRRVRRSSWGRGR